MPFQRSGVRKKYGLNKQKLAATATYLERSQPNFTTIIYARRATNPQNLAKIAQVLSEVIGLEPIITRSSAIAEGSRDASCQLKSCQLPRNSADTTCMTSPEQIEVMKLEGYSGAMCNKHVHCTQP